MWGDSVSDPWLYQRFSAQNRSDSLPPSASQSLPVMAADAAAATQAAAAAIAAAGGDPRQAALQAARDGLAQAKAEQYRGRLKALKPQVQSRRESLAV